MRIAILGATSHIAKNLIIRFGPEVRLFLFCRDKRPVEEFLISEPIASHCEIRQYQYFGKEDYDAIVNCVGIADPNKQRNCPYEIFEATERFDILAINYIKANDKTRYINFSSGGVFGVDFSEPVSVGSVAAFYPNLLRPADYYRISKLNAEAKHRCLSEYPIVDVRIYSFFSRFIDQNAGFLLSELARCLVGKKVFRTSREDIVRDYIAPDDLFGLVMRICDSHPMNVVLDSCSAKPLRKSEMLARFERVFGLNIEIFDGNDFTTVSGTKNNYYSINDSVEKYLSFKAARTSLEGVEMEMLGLLSSIEKAKY
jgi:hypothetical protein